jgi:hypothetical protein
MLVKLTPVVLADIILYYVFFRGKICIDYFSLDVEGAELAILKTIPWDKVDIK